MENKNEIMKSHKDLLNKKNLFFLTCQFDKDCALNPTNTPKFETNKRNNQLISKALALAYITDERTRDHSAIIAVD